MKLSSFLPLSHLALILSLVLIAPAQGAITKNERLTIKHVIMSNDKSPTAKQHADFKVALVDILAEQMGYHSSHLLCPAERCLAMLRSGAADIMVLGAITPERSKYLEFIGVLPETPVRSIYYVLKGREHSITTHADLAGLRIGAVKGYFYHDDFHSSPQITRLMVPQEEQLPKMLISGRIDAFISYTPSNDQIIRLTERYPQLAQASFRHPPLQSALLLISRNTTKHSILAKTLPPILQSLVESGDIKDLCQLMAMEC